jgi:hypothetical protein
MAQEETMGQICDYFWHDVQRQCTVFVSIFWHGYVLHEGITYKSRVPRTSQMTSRLLRHTAAAMRA